jgi:hypothetical protein
MYTHHGEDAYLPWNGMFSIISLRMPTLHLIPFGNRQPAGNWADDMDYWIAVCANAANSGSLARVVVVNNLQVVPENAVEGAFKENVEGKYIYIPEEFKSVEDISTDYQTLMFIPKNCQVGDYLSTPVNSIRVPIFTGFDA